MAHFLCLYPQVIKSFVVNIEKDHISNDFLFSSKNVGDTMIVHSTPLTIFEDFNQKDSCNNLNKLLGGGWWFAYKDSAIGGKSQVLPTSELGLVAAIDTSANAYSGVVYMCYFRLIQHSAHLMH